MHRLQKFELADIKLHSLYLPRCPVFVNNSVASGCLNPLFLEGFEYQQCSVILFSLLLISDSCVLGIGGVLTMILGVCHF